MSVVAIASGVFNSSNVFAGVNRAKYFSIRWFVASPSHEGVQRPKSAKVVKPPIRCISSSEPPAQYAVPINAPTLVPATTSIGILAARSTRNTPMCAIPLANPPASASPTRGRVFGRPSLA